MEQEIFAAGKRRGLTRNQIKYLAVLAMTVDHIAWAFVDRRNPLLGGFLHLFGRLTGPTMAYFVGEGYSYTKNVGKYQLRLALFALISWVPFVWFEYGVPPLFWRDGRLFFCPYQSVIFTLFLGLTAIRLWESEKAGTPLKILGIFLLCLVSMVGDWGYVNVLGCLFVHIFREQPKAKWTAFTLTFLLFGVLLNLENGWENNWYQLGVLLSPLLLGFCYNGESGGKSPFCKWFFYVFYPAHLILLGILRWVVKL